MKKTRNIILWVLSAVLLIFLLTSSTVLAKFLLALAILCLIPVSPIRKWFRSGRRPATGAVAITVAAAVLFVCAAVTDANSADQKIQPETRSIVMEESSESSSESAPEQTGATDPFEEPSEEPSESVTLAPTPETSPSPSETSDVPQEPSPEITPDKELAPARSPVGGNSNFDTYDNEEQQETEDTYVLNTSSMKVHHPWCESVKKIAPENYATSNKTIEELEAEGYTRCGQKGDWG